MTLSEELTWRGMVQQSTFANITDLDKEPRTFYYGTDPSADSMTIGNLAAVMMVRHFINHGHKAVLLVGGATGLIGDPDGKKQERDLKSPEEVTANAQKIGEQYRKLLPNMEIQVVNNYDWFKEIGYMEFLRTIGKHTSMTQLLSRDFIQSRIGPGGSGISYAEFSYALIQGYDFLHLYRTMGATLQLCGADQWGNSITGVDLIRKLESAEAHVFSTPLVINKQTGVKFGKSEGGAIWLDPAKTSPYQFYQFWLNVDDETAEDLVKIYTLLDHETTKALIKRHHENPGVRELQKVLASEVTDIVHGQERRESVERVTAVLFGKELIESLSEDDLQALAAEIPTVPPSNLIEALVNAGVVASNGEARRLIQGAAVSVNGQKVDEDINVESVSLVKKGKNSFILVKQ